MSMQASLSANARARFKRHLCHALLYAVLLVMAGTYALFTSSTATKKTKIASTGDSTHRAR